MVATGSYRKLKYYHKFGFLSVIDFFLVATGSCGNYQNFGSTTNVLETFSSQKKNGSYRFDPPKKFTVLWSRNLEPGFFRENRVKKTERFLLTQ